MMKKILSILFFITIVYQCYIIVLPIKEKLLPDYWQRYETLKAVFENSQYSRKDYQFWIPDETVYAYAGGAYLKGANPILVESTQPPVGKYLIALSIMCTNNENVGILISGALLLFVIFRISYSLMHSAVWSLGVVAAFLTEPLFRSQFSYMPLLDTGFVLMMYLGLLFTHEGVKASKGWLVTLSIIALALASQMKVWVSVLPAIGSVTFFVGVFHWTHMRWLIAGMIASVGVIVFGYTKTLIDGYGILTPLKVQKYLLWYHTSKVNGIGTIWPLIYLNQWYVWWGDTPVIRDENWSATWLVVMTGAFATWLGTMKQWVKKRSDETVYILFFLTECAFLTVGQANARYIYPVLPISYILSAYGFFMLIKLLRKTT